jgi:hypothetical protein
MADNLLGTQETIRKYIHRADFQSYIILSERDLLSKVRASDKEI